MKSEDFGLATLANMLSQFSREQINKYISQNCTNFCFLQEIEEFFVSSVGFYVPREFNVLTEFSTELWELPW